MTLTLICASVYVLAFAVACRIGTHLARQRERIAELERELDLSQREVSA